MNLRTSGIRIALAAVLLTGNAAPLLQAKAVDQAQIQAAMTLQFLSFTAWPGDPDKKLINIGVFEDEESFKVFEGMLQDERYRYRYDVTLVTAQSSSESLRNLDALFFPKADPVGVPRAIRRLEARPVVLIGTFEGFFDMGGMVTFIKRQRRLGFEIDVGRSRSLGIEYRAKLLRLATRIVGE